MKMSNSNKTHMKVLTMISDQQKSITHIQRGYYDMNPSGVDMMAME